MSYNTIHPKKTVIVKNGNKETLNTFHRMTQNLSCEHDAMLVKMYLFLFFTFIFENWDRKEEVFLIRIILRPAFYLCLADYSFHLKNNKTKKPHHTTYIKLQKLIQ